MKHFGVILYLIGSSRYWFVRLQHSSILQRANLNPLAFEGPGTSVEMKQTFKSAFN